MLKINTENSSLIISTEEKKRAEDQATILIQKIVRGFLANRQCVKTREEVISSAQFESAKEMIKTGSYLYFPRASSGITKVYFPTDLPFVLKASGLDKGYVRIQQMKQAFNYCKQKKFFWAIIAFGDPYFSGHVGASPSGSSSRHFFCFQHNHISSDTYGCIAYTQAT